MKCIFILCLAVTISIVSCHVLPAYSDEPRFVWIPDSDGVMHFEDLQDSSPKQRFVPDEDIIYYLYTRKNPAVGQVIIKGDIGSIEASHFDPAKPVKFTVHGWTANCGVFTNTMIRDAFLNVMDVNIITVDWSVGAKAGYAEAVNNAIAAAKSLGGFLDWLNTLGVSFSDMHLTGHSLGAQLIGIAGRSATLGQVEYISALDPAHPSWGPTSERIRKTDAKYVEVIHTNAGLLGMLDAVGHNDFYPNNGKSMPGCGSTINCSHGRSAEYMAYSIDNQRFMAVQCLSSAEAITGVANCTGTQTLYMGGSTIKPEIGIFALTTDAQPPYYQGREMCKNENFVSNY